MTSRKGRRSRTERFAAPLPDSVDVAAEVIEQFENAGARGEKNWPQIVIESRRFTSWLHDNNCPLDTLRAVAPLDGSGKPKAPWPVVVAWIDAVIEDNPAISPETLRVYVERLRAYLAGTGWSTDDWKQWQPQLSALVRNHRHDDPESFVRRPARPVTANGSLESMLEVIDFLGDLPTVNRLWADALRTFHLVSAVIGLRITECTCRLRWSWLHFDVDGLTVRTPGGDVLKYQADPVDLRIPLHPRDPSVCVVRQLLTWRKICQANGIPTGAGDLIFPAIRFDTRTGPDKRSPFTYDGQQFVADPVGWLVEDLRWNPQHGDPARRRFDAERLHTQRYRSAWKAVARMAGFAPRHAFERISPHGLRRGRATDMANNGATLAEISHHLRQARWETTMRYIDTHGSPSPDTRRLISTSDSQLPAKSAVTNDATESNAWPTQCAVEHSGVACSRAYVAHVERDGAVIAVCDGHRRRAKRGATGDAFTRPIASRHSSRTATCQVTHDSRPCLRAFASHICIDGQPVAACRAHAKRHANNKSGDELTSPIKSKVPTRECTVEHESRICGSAATTSIRVAGTATPACPAHAERYRQGRSGSDLTKPIHRATPGRVCQVTNAYSTCGGEYKGAIDIDGTATDACSAHIERHKRGLRGDRLTRPIRRRPKNHSGSC